MITIFSSPRPFKGIFRTIQINAIKSWLALRPQCQIILFEDEEGTTKGVVDELHSSPPFANARVVDELHSSPPFANARVVDELHSSPLFANARVADEFRIECVRDAERNEFGSLLLDNVFNNVFKRAENETLALIAADNILKSDFMEAVKKVEKELNGKPFYLVGRRWDVDIEGEIDFQDEKWEDKINEIIRKKGKLHGWAGTDCRVFLKSFNFNPPPLIVGRPGDDNWLIWQARSKKIPVIDITLTVRVVHQNHGQPHKKKDFFAEETERNIKLAGGYVNMMTLRDADWILTAEGLKRPPFPRRIFSMLSLFYPWRVMLALKRKLRSVFYGYK